MTRNKVIRIKCVECGITYTFTVDGVDYITWKHGAFIQDCMPYLPAWQRELLISGLCDTCFSLATKEEEK